MLHRVFYRSSVRLLLIGAGLCCGLLSLGAQAAVVTDVNVVSGAGAHADAAYLAPGSESLQELNALEGAFAGGDWSFLEITDDAMASTSFGAASFTLVGAIGAPAGDWRIRWEGAASPLQMDLVIVVKAADQWGAYLFNGVDMNAGQGSIEGGFDVSWFPTGVSVPSFRYMAVYGRTTQSGTGVIDEEAPPVETPVPGTPLLLGLALLGLARMGTRQLRR
ncbi:MAG: hypothetical protein Hals2KO_08410 [Halioglobus sp.]